ncbi:hypothetical protein D3C79_846830 [compost metagenome]
MCATCSNFQRHQRSQLGFHAFVLAVLLLLDGQVQRLDLQQLDQRAALVLRSHHPGPAVVFGGVARIAFDLVTEVHRQRQVGACLLALYTRVVELDGLEAGECRRDQRVFTGLGQGIVFGGRRFAGRCRYRAVRQASDVVDEPDLGLVQRFAFHGGFEQGSHGQVGARHRPGRLAHARIGLVLRAELLPCLHQC